MEGKKELLADILFNSKLVNLFKRLPMRNKLLILNYHRIRTNDFLFSTAFDDGVYALNQDELAKQIRWLKNNTRILSEQDLLDHHRDGVFIAPKTAEPCVMITFDDGYLDNYTLAYPILKYFDVPALLFVATQMVHGRQMPWWDLIAYLIKRSPKPVIHVGGRPFPMGERKSEAIAFFQTLMKQERYEHTKYLLAELSEACEVALPSPELQDRELLGWKEVREMAQHRIAIGSHTHTHRVLSTLSPSAQKEEMILSKLMIEGNIDQPVRSISYPVGEPHYITAETPAIAAAAGYLLGFTTNTGVNEWRSIQPHEIRRTTRLLEKVSTVSLLTVLPGLFSWDSAASAQVKTMEAHPTYADVYYRLGVIHLGQGKIEQAIESFQQAVDSNPDYTEARIKLGISQGFAGRNQEAEKNLLHILEKRPSFADIHYYLGIIHASDRKPLKAIQDLEKAVAINPAYKDALLKLGVLYCQQHRYRPALNMLERAGRQDPADRDLLTLLEAGRNIIAAHGDESSALIPLFSSYVGNSDQLDHLVKGFVTHLSISPNLNDIMAIVEKGSFPEESLKNLLLLFLDYRNLFPEYSDIHFMLGILYRNLGQFPDAEQSFAESLRLNPNYVKAKLSLFNLFNKQRRYPEALELGQALNRMNLLYPDLYCGLAETFLGLGRDSEAKEFAGKAVAISPAYQRAREVLQEIDRRDNRGA